MKYGLRDEAIKQIQNIFAKYSNVEEATLYGSRAKGNFKPGSDIDITLKGKELSLTELNRISLDLDDLYLPNYFDLSLYRHIQNQDLLEHIQRVGIALYRKQS